MKPCCCSSPCLSGCCGTNEHPARHPCSPGNASALPRLLGQLGKAFALATQNKVGSVLELWASPGSGGSWQGSQSPSCLSRRRGKNAAGCPHSCPAWAAPAGASLTIAPHPRQGHPACPQGRGWDRRGQQLTSAQQHHHRGRNSGGQGRLKWAPPACRGVTAWTSPTDLVALCHLGII